MLPAWLSRFILTCQAARPCGSNLMADYENRFCFVRFSRCLFDSFSLISIHELAQTSWIRPVFNIFHWLNEKYKGLINFYFLFTCFAFPTKWQKIQQLKHKNTWIKYSNIK
jgi:hypothetical protein